MNSLSKKIIFATFLATVSLACADVNEDLDSIANTKLSSATVDPEGRSCASMDALRDQLIDNPGLIRKMEEIERQTSKFIADRGGEITAAATLTDAQTIEIPVVVNVIYNTAQENISDAQIASQIAVLNNDFRATNSDVSGLNNTVFSGTAADFNIHYTLFAVNRKASTKTSWGTRDAMKSSKKGGIDPTDPTRKLNIWVCNIGGGILGYAQFPGGSSATDGVVIGPNYFGSSSLGSGFYLSAPYDKGRTATHEIGHWLNLRHIWGDATCGSDLVSDTPTHNTANYGCPTYPHLSTCTGTPVEMTMNYMDYTDDPCMYMFTNGQKVRARAIFATGGARATFVP